MVEDVVESLHTGTKIQICLESIVTFPAIDQYIHESLLYVSVHAIIFNEFYHPIAAKIHADQDLENLHSIVMVNPKTYHGKPSLALYGTIP